MYLACFEGQGGEWVQATAKIGSGRPHGTSSNWNWVGRQLSDVLRADGTTVARRIRLDRQRRLQQLIGITAPAASVSRLREIMARLTRTERLTGTSISLAQSREERDEWFGHAGEPHFCISRDVFNVRGHSVACDFRVLPFTNELLVDACLAGHAIQYQMHIRAYRPSTEELRAVRKLALTLQDIPGTSSTLHHWQDGMSRKLGDACAVCEEYLTGDSPAASAWLKVWLADRFNASFGRFGFPPPAATPGEVYEEELSSGLHSIDFEVSSPAQLCGNALSADERDALMRWQPSRELEGLLCADDPPEGPDSPHPPDTPIVPGVGPKTYSGEDVFAFASYKRQDLAHITPIMKLVRDFGVPLWYDAHIPGGSEWDEVIEDRLARSKFIILFSSNAAMESKYVRREIKYADAKDRPVLTIMLEDLTLRHGLDMLLTQYQMLDARSGNFKDRLKDSLQHLFV